MNENGLNDVMNLIKRQKWHRLFKRRELMHIDACKELYANLTMFHYKKHEVARSRVKGVEIEFDSLRLASILGVPGNTGICEYIKDVWEDSKYINTLETTRRFANHNMITTARRDYELPYGDWMTMIFEAFGVPLIDKQGEEPKKYDFFEETFLTMCQLKRENGVWWLGSGKNRRRDNEEADSVENEEVNEEADAQQDFDWEVVVDEATLQGESGSDDQFYDAEVEVEEPAAEAPAVPVFQASPGDSTNVQKEPTIAGVDPSAPIGSIPDSVFSSLQADFERAHANRIQADLERAQATNARLLAIFRQAQSQPKP
ncbi:hypothetical protein Dimus_022733 [Dionaea muscipula]